MHEERHDEEIVNYRELKESVEVLLTDLKPNITDYEIDKFLESLDNSTGNNSDELVLYGDIREEN